MLYSVIVTVANIGDDSPHSCLATECEYATMFDAVVAGESFMYPVVEQAEGEQAVIFMASNRHGDIVHYVAGDLDHVETLNEDCVLTPVAYDEAFVPIA
jgi:uncharacterized protein YkvS